MRVVHTEVRISVYGHERNSLGMWKSGARYNIGEETETVLWLIFKPEGPVGWEGVSPPPPNVCFKFPIET